MPKVTLLKTRNPLSKVEKGIVEGLPQHFSSPILRLRKKRQLSQRELATKCGISRGRLRRLEGNKFDDTTCRELKIIAQVLGTEVKELLEENSPSAHGVFLKRASQNSFQFEKPEGGYKIVAYLPPGQIFFVGKIFISPKKQVLTSDLPKASTIFFQMLLGTFQVTTKEETYEIGEGDSLLFHGRLPCTITNPGLRDSVAFLFTI